MVSPDRPLLTYQFLQRGKGRSSELDIYTVSYYARAVPVSVHLRPALTSQGGVDQIKIIEP